MQINRNQRCVSLNVEPENIPLNLSKKSLSKNLQEYKIRKNLQKKYRNVFKTQLNHIKILKLKMLMLYNQNLVN